MKAMRALVNGFSLAAVFSLAWASVANAAVYRISVKSPPVASNTVQAIRLDFGTKVTSMERVSMRITGIHTNGLWVGDGLLDHSVRPIGAGLFLYLFLGADIHVPRFIPAGWYEASAGLTNDGAFTVSLTLGPNPVSLSVPYIPAGQTALGCVLWSREGFGSVTLEPYLELQQVDIELEASPVLEINSVSAEGLLAWSALPPGGTVEVLTATDPSGPWSVEVRLPSETRSILLQRPQAATSQFYRLRWQEGASP